MNKSTPTRPPKRRDVPPAHCWDLTRLFPDDQAWESGLTNFTLQAEQVEQFRGTLGNGVSALRAALDYTFAQNRLEERLAYYAHLRVSEDIGDSTAQGRMARLMAATSAYHARASFITPEIQQIPDAIMTAWLDDPPLEPYRVYLRKLLRFKPHVLSPPEERVLAMQTEFAYTARQGFNALTDVDMSFGVVETPDGPQPLTHGSYAALIQHPDREVRQKAYTQYLAEFHDHRHTLAALYNGSVQRDVYEARVRNQPSAIAAALFADDVPLAVYEQLITTVHDYLPVLHRYYDLRRRALKLDTLRLYDTRVPLVTEIKTRFTYEEAVDHVVTALQPLGTNYTRTLREGLLGGWVDRYENKGKRSGAFSAGSYDGDPYILLNYKEEVLSDLFTLSHEAGHSMHSWYSAQQQPFPHYQYTIFVAEVASTFNEQWLAHHLLQQTNDPAFKAYLLNKQIDDILATLFRQTMFAEFERDTHAMVEQQVPLTVDSLTDAYAGLMRRYFGPAVPLEPHSALEGLRVPHFYSAFYVYQYATGLAAALALFEQVREGGAAVRDRYLQFLASGGSQFPLEQLRAAGVDLEQAAPLRTALDRFTQLVTELEAYLD